MSTEVNVSCEHRRNFDFHVHGPSSRPVLTFFYFSFFSFLFLNLKLPIMLYFYLVIQFNIKTYGKNLRFNLRLFDIIVHYMSELALRALWSYLSSFHLPLLQGFERDWELWYPGYISSCSFSHSLSFLFAGRPPYCTQCWIASRSKFYKKFCHEQSFAHGML